MIQIKLYSRGCAYALRCLAHLEDGHLEDGFTVKALSRAAKVPMPYARKVFQELARAGIVEGSQGRSGGYRLKRRPAHIKIWDVIRAIEKEDSYQQCIMGLDTCSDRQPCPLHKQWQTFKNDLIRQWKRITLRDVIQSARRKRAARRTGLRRRKV